MLDYEVVKDFYMNTKILILLFIGIVIITGCGAEEKTQEMKASPEEVVKEALIEQEMRDDSYEEVPTVDDAVLSFSTSVSDTNPSLYEEFTLTISAENEKGIRGFIWESSKSFSNYDQTHISDCDLKKSCTKSWDLIPYEEGLYEITIVALDAQEKESYPMYVEVNVGPSRVVEEEVVVVEPVEPEKSVKDNSCNSNSDCGYKQKCKSGICKTVQCTTSSHCSGCRRCSDNRCVSCGKGPYGCYC